MPNKTHRVVKKPSISARYLADYMAAKEGPRRTIIRGCKYRPIARLVQHQEAIAFISKYIRSGTENPEVLKKKAKDLREKFAADDFERKLLDYNADYLDRFASVVGKIHLPDFEILPASKAPQFEINGVKIAPDIKLRGRRITKTNKVRLGAIALRYAKGKPLKQEVGEWQSAFMFGYLRDTSIDGSELPESPMCITIDAQSGNHYDATSKAVSMYNEMRAACQSIAERWENVPPPPNSVL